MALSPASGYSTAYIGSSNLTHSAMVTGLEWNVRVSGVRNPDVVAKMAAVFESYWASGDFVPFDRDEFLEQTHDVRAPGTRCLLSPIEIVLRPFQERLLEQIELAAPAGPSSQSPRRPHRYRQDRDGCSRLRAARERVCHETDFSSSRTARRSWSRAAPRSGTRLRDAAFGEFWVGGKRPSRSNTSSLRSRASTVRARVHRPGPLRRRDRRRVPPRRGAVVPMLLERLAARELLGMTATPERADGLDVLRYFDGRIAAELRVWDAIDQQYLVPFSYFGVHDGTDLSGVPWKRGPATTPTALTNVLTADHAWARRVVEQVRLKTADPQAIKALGFCVTIAHARFMAEQFRALGIPAVAVWGDSPSGRTSRACAISRPAASTSSLPSTSSTKASTFRTSTRCLLLRPTESPTLFLQQLGRGLRRPTGKRSAPCSTSSATIAASSASIAGCGRCWAGPARCRTPDRGRLPVLAGGCHMELDPVAREIVLRSIREAIPSDWRRSATSYGRSATSPLAAYLEETGLELEDVYADNHSWSELRRAAGLRPTASGPATRIRCCEPSGRLLHVDDRDRLDAYRSLSIARRRPTE